MNSCTKKGKERKENRERKDKPTHINFFRFWQILLRECTFKYIQHTHGNMSLNFSNYFSVSTLYSLCWTVIAGGFNVVWDLLCVNLCFILAGEEQFQYVHCKSV